MVSIKKEKIRNNVKNFLAYNFQAQRKSILSQTTQVKQNPSRFGKKVVMSFQNISLKRPKTTKKLHLLVPIAIAR